MLEALTKAREIAKNNIAESQIKSKQYYDKKRRDVTFNIGDLVLVYTPKRIKGRSEKLLHPYHGPYRITKKIGTVVYEVSPISGTKKPDLVHVSRLKRYKRRFDELEMGTKYSKASKQREENDFFDRNKTLLKEDIPEPALEIPEMNVAEGFPIIADPLRHSSEATKN
ncbi:hypothetical protein B4U80_09302, partial [Leptotrombidium deliense]